MPRLQDLPDISKSINADDKILIIRPNSQGLTKLENLKPFVDIPDEEESTN